MWGYGLPRNWIAPNPLDEEEEVRGGQTYDMPIGPLPERANALDPVKAQEPITIQLGPPPPPPPEYTPHSEYQQTYERYKNRFRPPSILKHWSRDYDRESEYLANLMDLQDKMAKEDYARRVATFNALNAPSEIGKPIEVAGPGGTRVVLPEHDRLGNRVTLRDVGQAPPKNTNRFSAHSVGGNVLGVADLQSGQTRFDMPPALSLEQQRKEQLERDKIELKEKEIEARLERENIRQTALMIAIAGRGDVQQQQQALRALQDSMRDIERSIRQARGWEIQEPGKWTQFIADLEEEAKDTRQAIADILAPVNITPIAGTPPPGSPPPAAAAAGVPATGAPRSVAGYTVRRAPEPTPVPTPRPR